MSFNNLVYEGSVKKIYKEDEHHLIFEFTDDYSIFDWGKMPDKIKDKGVSLVKMAYFFFNELGQEKPWQNFESELKKSSPELVASASFQKLKTIGLRHHCVGPVSEKSHSTKKQTPYLKVKQFQVIRPLLKIEKSREYWDYNAYKNKMTRALIPLEVIFRFSITSGSSLLKRSDDKAYLQSLGLTQAPKINSHFALPIIEFSTKLENQDRYLSYAQAEELSGMSLTEFNNFIQLNKIIALRLKSIFKSIKIDLLDGKLEFAFGEERDNGQRDFILIDSIGPDELRLAYEGVQLSKEVLRQYYLKSTWYECVRKAKKQALEEGILDWKKNFWLYNKNGPDKLDDNLKKTISLIYTTLTDLLCGPMENESGGNFSLDQLKKELNLIAQGGDL